MLRLTPRQRTVLADTVPDGANIVAGALVIGFFLGEPRASWTLLAAGIAVWGAALAFAVMMTEHQ
jgi:hypothetical protein